MYEELVKRLRERAAWINFPHHGEECPTEDAKLMIDAANAIEERCQQVDKFMEEAARLYAKLPRWIPVTERLPDCFYGEEIGNVEWISHGTVYAGCFGRGGKFRDAYFRVWNDDTEGIDAKDAECWRFVLLPEPPKEETE